MKTTEDALTTPSPNCGHHELEELEEVLELVSVVFALEHSSIISIFNPMGCGTWGVETGGGLRGQKVCGKS